MVISVTNRLNSENYVATNRFPDYRHDLYTRGEIRSRVPYKNLFPPAMSNPVPRKADTCATPPGVRE
jgi:hypothetical protein